MFSPAVTSNPLPAQSALHARFQPGDFLDCYGVDAHMSPRDAAQIITEFPGWARGLVALRKTLTRPFGLINDRPETVDTVGMFPVTSETDQELIAGFNDRHLDFRVSVMSLKSRIYLATWVHVHHIGGRAYLAAIMPFHIAISRNALARVAAASAPLQPA